MYMYVSIDKKVCVYVCMCVCMYVRADRLISSMIGEFGCATAVWVQTPGSDSGFKPPALVSTRTLG